MATGNAGVKGVGLLQMMPNGKMKLSRKAAMLEDASLGGASQPDGEALPVGARADPLKEEPAPSRASSVSSASTGYVPLLRMRFYSQCTSLVKMHTLLFTSRTGYCVSQAQTLQGLSAGHRCCCTGSRGIWTARTIPTSLPAHHRQLQSRRSWLWAAYTGARLGRMHACTPCFWVTLLACLLPNQFS